MSAIEKPAKRGPKPRRPIPRKSERVPLRSGGRKAKPAKKRRATRTQLRALCDEIFSVAVRLRGLGRCKACGAAVGSALQCAHAASRRYLATRWESANAVGLCAGCHVGFTHNPLGWDVWVHKHMGCPEWSELKRTALRGLDGPPLYAEIAPLLVDELEAVHAAVPYDALTEALHERAREVLAKAARMGFEVTR